MLMPVTIVREAIGRAASLAAVLAVACGVLPAKAVALDTEETYNLGFSNYEAYYGAIGLGRMPATVFMSGLAGVGIAPRFSAFAQVDLFASEHPGFEPSRFFLGFLSTPIDGKVVDLDVIASASIGIPGFDRASVTPRFEINVDSKPDMSGFGLYTRLGFRIFDSGEALPGEESIPQYSRAAVELVFTAGWYWTVAPPNHQILLQYNLATGVTRRTGQPSTIVDVVGIGYNVVCHPKIEIITELLIALPDGSDAVSMGGSVGFIATVRP